MRRRVGTFVGLVMLAIASVPIVAVSEPSITGTISGVELCPQSICNEAVFSGSFAGRVKHRPTAGVFLAGITHEALPTVAGQSVAITGGTWLIRTPTQVFAGTVEGGGSLRLNDNNTFDVVLTMDLTTGGTGTLEFSGLLDHNPFPPTIVGTVSQ